MARLLGSNAAEVQSVADAKERYARAHDFFHATPLLGAVTAAPVPAGTPDPSVATDQGSVQFHLIGQKPSDPKYSDIMQQNADNLLSMGGLIYSYMKKTFPKVNLQSLDIDTWINVVQHLPDLTIGQSVQKTYKNRIFGVKVSGEFLSLIAKAIITDGASLLTDFTSYLNSIGDVTFSASNKSESYNVLTCTYMNYLVSDNLGGYYDYSAIALRQIKFQEYFQELRSSCASEQYVNIDMAYTEAMTLVQSRRIRKGGPDYENFQGLVSADATNQFKNANNFFNGGNANQSDVKPTV